MFKVIHDFKDLQDNDFVYKVGDVYPREGSEQSEERIAELSGDQNKIGSPLIEKVKQPKKKAEKKAEKKADEPKED